MDSLVSQIASSVCMKSYLHSIVPSSLCLFLQPFACAAVIGIALIWLTYLTIVQLFSGPKRDTKSSLPIPPRKVQGNGALPVFGHTLLFLQNGADIAHLFCPEWKEWTWNPWSRRLGDCFSLFIWGQWRIIVKGSVQCKRIIESTELGQGWAWSPPVTLLGEKCLPLLQDDDEDEAGCLRKLIDRPLCHDSVVKLAPFFAVTAQKCIEDITIDSRVTNDIHSLNGNSRREVLETIDRIDSKANDDLVVCTDSSSASSDADDDSENVFDVCHKIKFEFLRSYTFDLIDGPILKLNTSSESSCSNQSCRHGKLQDSKARKNQSNSEPRAVQFNDSCKCKSTSKIKPIRSRELMLLWMERLKYGLCDIKMTFGREWMQFWRLNWYGRAVNARDHLERIVGAHVNERDKLVSVLHKQGHSIRDPFASAMPLVSLTSCFSSCGQSPR